MIIVDSQLHDPAPWLEWQQESQEVQDRIMADLTLGWMDACGVGAAILFSGHGGWADEAAKSHPDRFASVPHVHFGPDDDVEGFVAEAKAHGGIVGLRSVIGWPLSGEEAERARAGGWDPMYAACEAQGMPVFLFATRFLDVADEIATRFPNLTLIVDHLGIAQPPLDTRESPTLKALPDALALAKHPNVGVKMCGLPALSAEPFPYRDMRPVLRQYIDAYGADRLMWGSDISRFYGRIGFVGRFAHAQVPYEGKHTYAESVLWIRENDDLSDEEKEWLLGGTIGRMLGWQPAGPKPDELVVAQ